MHRYSNVQNVIARLLATTLQTVHAKNPGKKVSEQQFSTTVCMETVSNHSMCRTSECFIILSVRYTHINKTSCQPNFKIGFARYDDTFFYFECLLFFLDFRCASEGNVYIFFPSFRTLSNKTEMHKTLVPAQESGTFHNSNSLYSYYAK